MADVLGTRLGRYEVRERIGRGGMATVYRAWDMNLERLVAVKVLHEHLAEDPDFKNRFEREAKLVAALSHPNIVQVFDFDHEERNGEPLYYMVMPLITGPTLRAKMEQAKASGKRLSLDEIEKVVEAVCGALGYAHQQGMVHRDVTPANILYNNGGGIVLADFGLAKLASSVAMTQTGMTTGTPIYMSPEQATGDALDARSDIYSFGVVLYEMLTGVAPFNGDTAYSIILQHVNDDVPLDKLAESGTAKAIQAVVLQALAKAPEDRFQNAGALAVNFRDAALGNLATGVRSGVGTVMLPVAAKKAQHEKSLPYRSLLGLAGIAALGIVLLGVTLRPVIAPDVAPLPTLRVLSTIAAPLGNSMTESSVEFTDDFSTKQHSAWMLTSSTDQLYRKFEDGVLRIRNMLPATAATTTINRRSAEYGRPITIVADLRLSDKSQTPSATGIVFRYRSDDEYYVFAFDGQRRVSMWLRKSGKWTELRNLRERWTPSDAVKPPGEVNSLRVVVNEDSLIGSINGREVIRIKTESQIMSGGVGVYTATTTNENETQPLAEVDVLRFGVLLYVDDASVQSTPGGAS